MLALALFGIALIFFGSVWACLGAIEDGSARLIRKYRKYQQQKFTSSTKYREKLK